MSVGGGVQDFRGMIAGGVAASRAHLLSLFIVIGLVAVLTSFGWRLSNANHTPFIDLMRDANVVGHLPWYSSGLEYVGFVIMSISVGSIALAASLVSGEARSLLIKAGFISLVLIIDDIFMMHEHSPRIGLSEKKVFALYALYIVGLFALHWRYILRTPVLTIGVAMLCFAVSAVLDSYDDAMRSPSGSEDVAELLGFALWANYWAIVARNAIIDELAGARAAKSAAIAPAQAPVPQGLTAPAHRTTAE
jgi:hypothetical protein